LAKGKHCAMDIEPEQQLLSPISINK